MQNTVKLEVKFRSLVETFIEEFTGIPGLTLSVNDPTRFTLTVSAPNEPYRITNNIVFTMRSDSVWIFRYTTHNSSIWNEFYQINVNDIQGDYIQNTLLEGFLKALFTLAAGYMATNLATGHVTSNVPEKNKLSNVYINLGVKMGVLLCGERRLTTDCHFHGAEGLTIFPNTMIANDLLSKYDRMTKELETLNALNDAKDEEIIRLQETKKLYNELIEELDRCDEHCEYPEAPSVDDMLKDNRSEYKQTIESPLANIQPFSKAVESFKELISEIESPKE